MTDALATATTLDVYEWPVGGRFDFSWSMQTSPDPRNATSGDTEDVSDVTAITLWMRRRVGRNETPATPIVCSDTGGQLSLDQGQSPAILSLSLTDDRDGTAPEGTYDCLINFTRGDDPDDGGDDVAAFVLERPVGPRPPSA